MEQEQLPDGTWVAKSSRNKTGYHNVVLTASGQYQPKPTIDGKQVALGTFATPRKRHALSLFTSSKRRSKRR